MAPEYSDLLADVIATRMRQLFRGRRNELQQRIKEMVQGYREKNDPRIDLLADHNLRVCAFLEHTIYMAGMLCCWVRHDYLYPDMDIIAAYDAASMQVEELWETKWPDWVKGFRSSIVLRMVEDRKAMKKVVKDVLPLLLTPEEMLTLRDIANARDQVLALINLADFVRTLNFQRN
jgi:hypothetical protein